MSSLPTGFHHRRTRFRIARLGMFTWRKLACTLLVLTLGLPLLLRAEPIFQFHTINRTDGLASSVVFDIEQDRAGYVWFATEDGLQKYDGFELVTYRQDRKNTHSLSNNIVRVLMTDRKGALWVGTNGGLNLYQKELDQFRRFNTENSGLTSDHILNIYQSGNGSIWVGTKLGLTRIDTDSYQMESYGEYEVRSILEDNHKQMWIGTLHDGLFLFDRISKQFQRVKIQGVNDQDSMSSLSIVALFQDSYGRILVGTWGEGVFILDGDNRTMSRLDLALPNPYVRNIRQDDNGKIWVGTRSGILVRDAVKKTNRIIRANPYDEASLKVENITNIFQGTDKTMWIGTYGGGVSRHYPSSRRFESYGKHPDEKEGLIDPVVYALFEDSHGYVWVGTENGYLSRFDPRTKTFEHIQANSDRRLVHTGISAIEQVADNLLLVGTEGGLLLFDTAQKKIVSRQVGVQFDDDKPRSVRLVRKDPTGAVWVGYNEEGFRRYRLDGQKLKNIPLPTQLHLKRPNGLAFDDNKIYFADYNSGIYSALLGPGGELTNLSKIQGSENAGIYDIRIDWAKRLWTATWSNGIKIFMPDGTVKNINESNGMPNDSVYSIIPDVNSHRIWAATNYGIISIAPNNFSIVSFTYSDGLQGNEFNRPGFRSSNGYLYFGGVNGFNRFYPNVLDHQFYVAPPEVTGLRIANQKVAVDPSRGFTRSMSVATEVQLNYDQTPFTIEFSSPQYVKPKRLEFRYRLLGLSETWINAAADVRRATYTNIPAGDYQFELQVRGGGNWIESSRVIHLHITPPWWLTRAAKLVYFIFALTFVSLIWRMTQLRRQRELDAKRKVERSEQRLKLSLWGGGFEIWDWDLTSGKVTRSDERGNIHIETAYLSRNLRQLSHHIHPNDLDMVKEEMNKHLSGLSDHYEAIYRVRKDSDKWQWIQDRGKVVEYDSQGTPQRMSGMLRDITDIREREDQFAMLGQAFKSTSDGVWIRDHEWRLIECNPAYERITGFSLSEKRGEILWFPDTTKQQPNLIQRIRLSMEEKGNWQGEVWAERKNSDPFPQTLSIDTLKDENGNVRYYVGVFSDITFQKRSEEEFRRLANYDSLTGLPNRPCLIDRIKKSIENANRRNEQFAVFMLDIDNFKRINDSMGHNVGDELITQIANRLVNCNREGDTVARYGGDEFVIVREDVLGTASVATFAETLLTELNQPIFLKGEQISLNFSIGIALAPTDGMTVESLLLNADQAMYEAKKNLLNSYQFHSMEFNERAKKRLALENALREALDEKQITLYYQPKVDLNTGRVCGVEALARWTHPTMGVVSPVEFIPLAEETGLIVELGKYILEMAATHTKSWVDSGIIKGRTSINLSAHQLWYGDILADIDRVLKKTGLASQYLEFEITESVFVKELEITRKKLQAIRDMGIHLSLDDFGTGYSSMSILKTLPFNVLKVDKSFVDDVETNEQNARVVKAIIDIARAMDMELVVEGVENKEQCQFLWLNRAFVIQGYFFSRPVKFEGMVDLFNKTWPQKDFLTGFSGKVTPFN